MLGSNPVMYSFFFSFCLFFFSFLVYTFLFFIPINFTKLKQQPHQVTDRWCRVRILLSTPSFFSLFFFFFFFFFVIVFALFCFVCLFVFFFNINLNSCYLIKSNTNKLCSNHPSFLLNFGVNYSCSFYAFLFHCNIFYKTKKVATCSHRLPFIFVAVVLVIRELQFRGRRRLLGRHLTLSFPAYSLFLFFYFLFYLFCDFAVKRVDKQCCAFYHQRKYFAAALYLLQHRFERVLQNKLHVFDVLFYQSFKLLTF